VSPSRDALLLSGLLPLPPASALPLAAALRPSTVARLIGFEALIVL
jgi:hypothetical protein